MGIAGIKAGLQGAGFVARNQGNQHHSSFSGRDSSISIACSTRNLPSDKGDDRGGNRHVDCPIDAALLLTTARAVATPSTVMAVSKGFISTQTQPKTVVS